VSGLGTGVATALAVNTGSAGAFVPTTGSGASGTWGIDISGNAATATSATSATTATNLAGGAANRVPYQSASGTTTFVAAPTVTNSYLKWNGTSLGWDTVSGGGGGSGDVVGPASATDSQIALFNSTTGKLIKAATTTGLLKASTGVIAAAVSGTDYAPATSGSANQLLASNGTGGFTNLTTGTGVVTALGVNTGSSGAFVVNGGALGTPLSGTVTNLTGTASININGTVGATTPSTGAFTTLSATGNTTFTPAARTSGAASYFTVTTPADTGQTASTEVIGANYTAATRQWATGALTLQRERVFAAPTYSFVGASTLTTAVNVDIATPVQGTNATITNAYALRAGASYFTSTVVADGNVTLNGGTANGVLYLNGSKVATSGSALTFDGTKLVATATTGAATTYPAYFDNSGGGVGTGVRIGFRNTGASYGEVGYLYDGTFATIINSAGSDSTRLLIGGTEQMRLTSTGLGIGTTSPATRLHATQTSNGATVRPLMVDNGGNSGTCVAGISFANGGVVKSSINAAVLNNDFMTFCVGGSGDTERVRIGGGGEVYFPSVGTTASAANAFLNNGSTPANQLLRSTSSLRYKTDVETLDHAKADAVLNLRPVWYRSKAEADRKDWSWYGLIAEEVAQVEPRLVHWSYPEDQFETIETQTEIEKTREVEVTPAVLDDEGNVVEPAVTETETYTETETKSERKLKADAQLAPDGVQYDRLTVMLLDIVKRQNQRIEQLEAKVAAMEAQ